LSSSTSERKLKRKMEKYGSITSCNIIIDKVTRESKKYGFAYFKNRVG